MRDLRGNVRAAWAYYRDFIRYLYGYVCIYKGFYRTLNRKP